MNTTITVRHCELPAATRERLEQVAARLEGLTARVLDITAVCDMDGDDSTVELRLRLGGGDVLVAAASAGDHRTALDRAEDKVRRQLRRAGEQRAHRSRPTNQPS